MVARPVVSLRHGAAAAPALLGEGPVWDRAARRARVGGHRARARAPAAPGHGGCLPRRGPAGGLRRAARGRRACARAAQTASRCCPPGGGRPARGAGRAAARRHADERRRLRQPRALLGGHDVRSVGDTRTAALYRLDSDLTRDARAARPLDLERHRLEPRRSPHVPRGHAPAEDRRLRVRRRRRAIGGRRAAIAVAPERRPAGWPGRGRRGRHLGGALGRRRGAALQPGGSAGRADRAAGEPGHELLLRRPGSRDALRHDRRPRRRSTSRSPARCSACRPGVHGLPATPFAG